jgi:hypothetical protein
LKNLVEKLVNDALAALPADMLGEGPLPDPAIERSRDLAHGDFATGVAMRLAKAARANPRKLAEKIVAALPANSLVAKTEIAGPGFINFFLTPAAWQAPPMAGAPTAPAGERSWSSCLRTPRAPCTSATAGTRPSGRRSRTCSKPTAGACTASTT